MLTSDEMSDESKGETGDDDEEIGHCQIGQEDVGDGMVHRSIAFAEHCDDDEDITD